MQDPVYSRLRDTPRPSLNAASALVLLAVAGLWLVSLAAWRLAAGEGDSGLVNLVFYVPFMLLPAALYARGRGGLGAALRLGPMPALSTLTVALLALMSVFAASALSYLWEGLLARTGLPVPAPLAVPEDARALMLAILTMAALPAVCEELLFRGIVLSAWESRGTGLAVGVSTLLFALIHGNLYGLPAYALVGGLAAYLVVLTDSLYAGITFHTVYNTACLVIPFLAQGQAGEEAAAAGAEPLGVALELAVTLLMMAMTLFTVRLRSRAMGVQTIPRIRRPLDRGEKLWFAAVLVALVAGTLVLVLGGLA